MFPMPSLVGRRLLLASASPRRRQLLSQLAVPFEIAATIEVDERYPDGLDAMEVAPYLSRLKAEAYKPALTGRDVLVTADTVVINGGKVLGKPADSAQACEMLAALSGRSHHVVTGVTLSSIDKSTTFSAVTEVEFAQLTDSEIDFYVNAFSPLDKAGAYGIQEWIGCVGVKRISGSYYNVMGLPLHRLFTELKNF